MLKFKQKTSYKGLFTNIFKTKASFKAQMNKWLKTLKRTVFWCFQKVRFSTKRREPKICKKFQKRRKAILNNKKAAINEAEDMLKNEEAIINMNKIYDNINSLKCSKNSQKSIWTFKNKIIPKIKPSLPTAKKNISGKIITNAKELKDVYLNHFHHRMRQRLIMKNYENYKIKVEKYFLKALKCTKNISFSDWTLKDLECVLKSLKKSQSPDYMGIVNELFMLNNIGEDLKLSLLQLFNGIKNSQIIPEFFQNVYITSIPKRGKSPIE